MNAKPILTWKIKRAATIISLIRHWGERIRMVAVAVAVVELSTSSCLSAMASAWIDQTP